MISSTSEHSYSARLFQCLLYFETAIMAAAFALQLGMSLSADERDWPVSFVALANFAIAGCLAFLAAFIHAGDVLIRRLLLGAGILLLLMPVVQQIVPEGSGDCEDVAMSAAWLLSCGLVGGILIRERAPALVRNIFATALVVQGLAMITDLALDDDLHLAVGYTVFDWIYASAFSLSAVFLVLGFQLFATELAERQGLIERVGRSLHKHSYREPGRHISIAANKIAFQLWKWRHSGATFADFYAETISRRIRKGGSHRTLGPFRHFTRSVQDSRDFSHRGLKLFARIIALGLRRDRVCVDFGCGSLRIGQHAIEYLDDGNYIGLDLVDTFYNEGLKLLPAHLRRKSPWLSIISETSLRELRAANPGFVFSIAVLKHIPPSEIDTYIQRILSLAHDETTILIDFEEGKNGFRTGANNWKYSREFLTRKVLAHSPPAKVVFAAGSSSTRIFLVVTPAS